MPEWCLLFYPVKCFYKVTAGHRLGWGEEEVMQELTQEDTNLPVFLHNLIFIHLSKEKLSGKTSRWWSFLSKANYSFFKCKNRTRSLQGLKQKTKVRLEKFEFFVHFLYFLYVCILSAGFNQKYKFACVLFELHFSKWNHLKILPPITASEMKRKKEKKYNLHFYTVTV